MTIRVYRPKLFAAVVVVLLSLGTATSTQTPYTYTVIADLGSSDAAWPPSINNSGQVAFVTTNISKVFRGDGAALTLIYSGGPEQPAPNGHSPVNAAGLVVFGAGGPPFFPRIVAGDGTAPATVVAMGGSTWESVGNPSINDDGEVVFEARLHGTEVTHILRGSAFEPIASPGDTVPGGTLTSAYGPKINNIADVAFTASVDAGPGSIFRKRADDLMFMGPASALGELTFGMNDAGVVAFWRGAPGRIVTSDGVTERIIAEQSADFVPQPHRAAINDAGRVAFVASDGTGAAARRVLVGDGTDLHQVLHAGDFIPGLGTVLDVSISNDAINDVGQVAILVTYDDGTDETDDPKYAIVRANPPTNRAPVAIDRELPVTEDGQATGTLEATDPDGNPLVFSVVSNGSLGTVTITNAATGQFSYSPAPDANGSDTFTFKVNDGSVDSNVATVTVSIAPVNDAPLASTASGSVSAGQTSSGTLVASDVDGDSLTYAIVTNGTKGTATITNSSTGAYTYQAFVGSSGTDTFTFKANDGTVDSNEATVTMTISAAPAACAADVTAVVEVIGSTSRIDRKTGDLTQKVTLKNVGSSSLAGPIVLVLDSLPSGLNVINPSGTTACTAPFGSPYVMVNIGADSVLKVREKATVALRFTQTGSAPLNYTARVLAGAGAR